MTGVLSSDDPLRAALERAIGFQYDIIRLLGRGGMGAVYHAHERALDRPVAIKVLPPEVAGTTDARERFLREARTAARLTHPNIVPLFTFGDAQGLVYYVMGYVDGESLDQRLKRGEKLDPMEAARILGELASALEYAHQQGIVHRDVKPDNVLIERGTGVAKLTDFGIAKRAAGGETLTGIGMLMGTPKYMSPEQASGDRDLDARSDIYSLGLVGYAMLTGRPPFDGASVQEILTQQVTRDAPSLRKLLPDMPTTIVTALDRALQKDPKDRHKTAGLFRDALVEDEDENIPLSRRGRMPGVWGISNAVTLIAVANCAWWAGMSTNAELIFASSLLVTILPAGILLDYGLARWVEKRTPTELRRMLTEAPKSWRLWWPARWRRKDDVFFRLPKSVRLTRNLTSLGIGLFVVGAELAFLIMTSLNFLDKHQPLGVVVAITAASAFFGSLCAIVGAALRGHLWGKKSGLNGPEADRFFTEPTGRPQFWLKAHVARFLSPRSHDPADAEPRSPQAILDALPVLMNQLPATVRESAGDVVAAARQLVAALDVLDGQIATMSREADPAEIARLEDRLTAPGNEEMRRLYASQLELLRRLVRQSAELSARRARYAELLRTLWLQVASLRAQHAADEVQATDISGKIRDICRGVQHEVEGAREVARLVAT